MIQWLLAIIYVEAITEIFVESDVFTKFRLLLKKLSNFTGELISCGYCFSVWAAMPVGWALPGDIFGIFVLDAILKTFILHRLANIFHECVSRWFGRFPFVFVISKPQESDDMIISEEDE